MKVSPRTICWWPIRDGHRRANSQATPREHEGGQAGRFQIQDLTCSRHSASSVAIRSLSGQ
ncbi:hypothetical protein K443DRAFT_638646, partial [Laccaria amethystina LaAM-08-1]